MLPDRYWETYWEVAAWNTRFDEPFVDFFATKEEAEAEATKLRKEGYADVCVVAPSAISSILSNPTR